MCSLKLLANQQLGGDPRCWWRVSRNGRLKIMDTKEVHHGRLPRGGEKVGDLEHDWVALPIVEPMFSVDCPDAAILEGRTAHFHRDHERGRKEVVTTTCGRRPALSLSKPSTGASRNKMGELVLTSSWGMGKAVNMRQSNTSRKAKTL